jgi:O-antigen ligase
MPPQLALLICLIFMGYLFWVDLKRKESSSNELWIPLTWMFLTGSRYASKWISMTPADTDYEGSPVDAVVFGALIAAGFFVLSRRKIDWGQFFARNKWLMLYFIYCGVSIIWSDYPFVSFKRWIKELGSPVMVLVILTDRHPVEAIDAVLRRLAILWLPLSVVFFKYFPALGRQYHESSGEQFATGVSLGKNGLGIMCLVCGIYFSWKYIVKHREKFKWDWQENISDFALMGMTIWLLQRSQSATAMVCVTVTVMLFLISRTKLFARKPDGMITMLLIFIPLFYLLEETFGVTDVILDLLGRDRTLTTRVPMWEFLKTMVTNPILGSGYHSFWMGERLDIIWGFTGRNITQAHNGYLEQYLNLGYIGLAFIVVIILSGFLKVKRQLNLDFALGMLCLCIIVSTVLYNHTEALFYGINNVWLLTLFAVTDIPIQKTV